MIPPKCYWPPELLARALPERYGHLLPKESAQDTGSRAYTVERVSERCSVIRPRFGTRTRPQEQKA